SRGGRIAPRTSWSTRRSCRRTSTTASRGRSSHTRRSSGCAELLRKKNGAPECTPRRRSFLESDDHGARADKHQADHRENGDEDVLAPRPGGAHFPIELSHEPLDARWSLRCHHLALTV